MSGQEYSNCPSLQSVLSKSAKHIDERVDSEYPLADFGTAEGKVPQGLLDMVKTQEPTEGKRPREPEPSIFDMKQSTLHDSQAPGVDIFQGCVIHRGA